ncbi:MAG: hypothetical protein R3A48_24605 [Polyangiales bacterium]
MKNARVVAGRRALEQRRLVPRRQTRALHRRDPRGPRARLDLNSAALPDCAGVALVAGAAAGFVGTLTQQFVCPVAVASHTMTSHAAPVLIGALAALLLARRTLSAVADR